MKKPILYFALIIGLLLSNASFSQNFITYFNSKEDLKSLQSTEGVKFAKSTDFPILGAYSCKVDFPEKGGEFKLLVKETESFKLIEESSNVVNEVLLYYIWSNEVGQVIIEVKNDKEESYSKTIKIKKGSNHIQLILAEMTNLDVDNLKSIAIKSNNKQTLYVDYIAYDTFQPVLDELGYWGAGDFTTEIETSHYSWGEKLANGTINTFSISPVFDGRGIVELAQRLDIKMDVSTIGRDPGAERYGYGDFYKRRVAGHGDSTSYNMAQNYILDKIYFDSDADVIIWPGIHSWDIYPKQIKKTVLKMVKEGTGLVFIYPRGTKENSSAWELSPLKSLKANQSLLNTGRTKERLWWEEADLDMSEWKEKKPHYITRGVALDAFPWGHMGAYKYQSNGGDVLIETQEGTPVLAVKKYGKGRVVALGYPEKGLLPLVENPWETGLNYPYWEYMWSLVSRSVVWASGKDSDTSISKVIKSKNGLDIALENLNEAGTVEVQITDDFGKVEDNISVKVKAKQIKLQVKFNKSLNGGKHLVKVQLKGSKGIYDWYAMQFESEHNVNIVKINNQKDLLAVGDQVEATITLNSEKKVKGTLVATLFDNYGRSVGSQKQEVSLDKKGSYSISIGSKDILTNIGKLDIAFFVKENQVDHKTKQMFFQQPRIWDDYDITMYSFSPNPAAGAWEGVDKQLRALNVTTLAAYTLDNSRNANYKTQAQTRIQGVESPDGGEDLEYIDNMVGNYLKTKDKYLLVRKYGLNDSTYLHSVRDDLIKKIKEWKKYSPTAYYIFEEPAVTKYATAFDLDFSETSLMAMRNWLKTQYASLDALNKQWGTKFKTWETVVPDDSFEARERGNFSSWGDHRTFMEVSWANLFKYVQEVVNENDPGGLVQLSGTQAAGSHNGYDYSRINPYVGQMNPYNVDNQLEYLLAFNPDLKVSGKAGYGKMGKKVTYDYYNNIFLNETGGSYIFWQLSCLNPDLTINRAGTDMKNGYDELLKRGIGRMIANYNPDNELKIAIHYSQPSIHGTWIADGFVQVGGYDTTSKTLVQYNKNRDGWVKSLHDLGYGFDFIAYGKIETGDLISKGYKIFILPMSYALSDKEVEEIKAFVKAGGILIADALPGVMDDHTKIRSQRALADVFGIKAKKYSVAEITTPTGESNLQLKGAKVLLKGKDKSEILYHKYGKGSAYLMNFLLDSYPEQKKKQTNDEALSKLKIPFQNENIESSISITKPNGDPEKGVEKYGFTIDNESTHLLGLLPGMQSVDRNIIMNFEKPIHLYNIRAKKYIGYNSTFEIGVKNTVPEFFGMVDNKIEDFNVTAPSQVNKGEQIALDIEFSQDTFSNFTTVVVVDVYNPKGERINYYSRNCDIKNGVGAFNFTTANNELNGDWKIKITEVISSIEKEITVLVQ